MIKIKLSKMGGYVVGDGKCPIDPDNFMKLFAHKIMEAQAKGLTEIGFNDEEIARAVTEAKDQFDTQWDATPVTEMPNKAIGSVRATDRTLAGLLQ